MPGKPTSFDDYLARLPDDQRAALERLRAVIHAAAPGAEEAISYQIPMFRLHGMLVGMGARKNHCALYLMSKSTGKQFAKELASYDTSTGTVRFTPDKPLPASLVKKLVKARVAENAAID